MAVGLRLRPNNAGHAQSALRLLRGYGHTFQRLMPNTSRRSIGPLSKKGAPQARQVSDRWHLVKNLAECVSIQLAHSLTELRRAEQTTARSGKKEGRQVSGERRPARTRAVQYAQQTRQAERTARYEQIMALQKEGVKIAEIALQLGVTQRTMRAMDRDWNHSLLWPTPRNGPVSLIPTRRMS